MSEIVEASCECNSSLFEAHFENDKLFFVCIDCRNKWEAKKCFGKTKKN